MTSINPSTGKVIATIDEWNKERIDRQIDRSMKAFLLWMEMDYSERSVFLKKTAQVLRNNKKRYASLITQEMGKPIVQAELEVEKCAWVCEYYAENGMKMLMEEHVKTDASSSYIRFSPLGIILAVMPWNFPFWQVFRCAAPALMAGNVILLKHSSNVPQCAIAIEEVFKEAGTPDNVFSSALVGSQGVERIIQSPCVAAVTFTGSTVAGKIVAEKAGRYLKKTVLELGGNDPFIVLGDVDVEDVVKHAVEARMINNGQSCIAAKRFVVEDNIFEEFQKKFSEQIKQLTVGDPMDRKTDIGPLAREDILRQLEYQVQKSVAQGATVVARKNHMKKKGYYYPPILMSNIKKGMPVYDEETFGPVAPLIKANDEKEIIDIANDTSYGLGASIWTNDDEKAEALSKQIQAGMVFINEIVKSDPRLPFGGIKESGYGRELSQYGIKEFVNIQTVWKK
ncbi:MAG: NAD-dependent succinate-semialdehyde dehydrogenase [Thermoplasmata archaeon]|nr:MAG: NAD-dependent succinate-semialdehyde dehydrogenase [Thermoplasmata archaeon]